MSKIHLLSEIVSNRIAAGEVVERPASIVKELVENSFDAGATAVSISVTDGGIKQIRVTDNGGGIEKDDFPLTVVKHATSKILTLTDLNNINSMGFRGEALASIAAVSCLTIKSRTPDSVAGCELYVRGGKTEYIKDAGLPEGTSVVVDDLFFNTPARLKFLKKPASETAAISELVGRLILAYPGISIRYTVGGKEIYHSPGNGSIEDAIISVFGSSIKPALMPVDFSYNDVNVSGYIGRPSDLVYRTGKNGAFFVNSRYFRSSSLQNAVYTAYGERLLKGSFPFYALYIDLDASDIDVNVHPNKLKVNFSDERAVVFAVQAAIDEVLSKNISTPVFRIEEASAEDTVDQSDSKSGDETSYEEYTPNTEKPEYISEQLNDLAGGEKHIQQNTSNGIKIEQGQSIVAQTMEDDFDLELGFSKFETKRSAFINGGAGSTDSKTAENSTEVREFAIEAPQKGVEPEREQIVAINELGAEKTDFRVIGSAFATYLLVETGDVMYMIDQHAAHERMIYNRLLTHEKSSGVKQFLVPETVHLSPADADTVDNNMEIYEKLGVDIEKRGELLYEVTAIPDVLGNTNISKVIEDIAKGIETNIAFSGDILLEKVARAACRQAIKAGQRLSDGEIEQVVYDIQSLGSIPNCPHGRPIAIAVRKSDIEKSFKRRQ